MIIDTFPEETHKGSFQEGLFELKGSIGYANAERLQRTYGFKMEGRAADFDDLRQGDFISAENMKGQNRHHIVRF